MGKYLDSAKATQAFPSSPAMVAAAWVTPDTVTLSGNGSGHAGSLRVRTGLSGLAVLRAGSGADFR